MKDFAGSSITYYGLAREKLMNKYPRLPSVLVILALICMTGLAIFLISDLVSFVSNPDYKGAAVGIDIKVVENGIAPTTNDKGKSEISKINASMPLNQSAKGIVAASKSSSISPQSSVNEKSGNNPIVARHHSSSSSSSSKSSSSNSAIKSGGMSNQTNMTAINSTLTNGTMISPTQTNQSIDNSQESASLNVTVGANLPQMESGVATTSVLSSLTSATIGSFTNPSKNSPAREPESIIEFKTKATISPKSEQSQSTDTGANTDGASVSDSTNKAKSLKDATQNFKLKTIKAKSDALKNSKLTASSQAAKVKEARDKIKANKDRIEQNMKKKAAQLKSKTASN